MWPGSQEEIDDLIEAYEQHSGSLPKIMEEIPHSQHDDEPRFIKIINDLIASKQLKSTPTWKKTSTDEKARAQRGKAAAKSAQEAEAHAKELGVWDEFYGDKRKGKRKSDATAGDEGVEKGEDALAALILRRQKDREGGLDRLAAKYAKIEEEERARKKGKKAKGGKKGDIDAGEEPASGPQVSQLRLSVSPARTYSGQDISDADFEALQAKMFGGREKAKKGKAK